jgi:hypothetical protein
MIDDIIDVTVTLSSQPETYSYVQSSDIPPEPAWATRQERYAWRREAADLLVPELEIWARISLEQWHWRAPAVPETLAIVKGDLDMRLRRIGVSDVFTSVVSLTSDSNGIPCIVTVGLALTDDEVKTFGEQPPIDRD